MKAIYWFLTFIFFGFLCFFVFIEEKPELILISFCGIVLSVGFNDIRDEIDELKKK
jgi:nucleoside recognition membrane protein YjiH